MLAKGNLFFYDQNRTQFCFTIQSMPRATSIQSMPHATSHIAHKNKILKFQFSWCVNIVAGAVTVYAIQ